MIDFVVLISPGVICLSLLLLTVLSVNFTLVVALYLVPPRPALAAESRLMAEPLPPANLLPRVLVQLPVFNERNVIDRLIEAAAGMDWPRDRFEIQVLDDSTDDTTALARLAVDRVEARGIRATL